MKKFFLSILAVLSLSVAGWAIVADAAGPEPDNVVVDTLDLTSKLANPNFNDGQTGWTVNKGKIEVKAASTGNPVVTAYNYQMDISQTVTGLEPGNYLVKVQACSRSMNEAAGIADYESRKANGQEIPNEAYLYANGVQKKLVNIWDETSTYDFATECGKDPSIITMSNGEQIPYNSTNFSNAFGKLNMYWNELECTVGADGELTIGLKNELSGDGLTPYVGYDNFRLYKINKVEEYTSQLANPNFNDGTAGWTVNTGKIEVKAASTGNPVVTAYGYKVDVSQKVTGLIPGIYVVKVQACSRYMDKAAGIADYESRKANGQEIPNEAYLYANGEQQKVVNIFDETSTYDFATESGQAASDLTMSNGEQIPYNSTNFAHAFGAGMYENELTCKVGKDGELTVGIKNMLEGDGYQIYVGYDNFRLYRVGDLVEEEEEPGDEPGDQPADNRTRLAIPNGSGNGSELTVEVLEQDEAGNPLAVKYTVKNGTWGDNASHLSFFKFAPLSAATIEGYEKIVVEFAETVPTSTGDKTYGFIPVGLVSPVGWTSMNGLDKWEYTFTESDKTDGISDFSLFFNASGDLKDIEVTITGIYLVKAETEEPGEEPGEDPTEEELDMSKLTDMTDKLVNPNFDGGSSAPGWTVNTGKIEVKAASTGNPVVTAYNYQVDICQTVEGLEPGKYVVMVQACSRYMNLQAGIQDYEARKAAGKEIPNEAYVYANGEQKKVKNIFDETADYDFATESSQKVEDLRMSNGGQIPYNSTNFANAFGKFGMYQNHVICTVGKNGVLNLGIKNELTAGGDIVPYLAYDNFRLYKMAEEAEDCTDKIVNPGFTDDSSSAQSGWTLVTGTEKGKWSKGTENRGFSCNNIKCELTQTVEGLTPGKYMLKYQAFGRMKANADSWASYLAGEDLGSTNVYMIANSAKKEVMNVVYGATPTKGAGDWTEVAAADGTALYLLNNSGAVADAFAQGYYQDSLVTEVGSNGILTITFLKESEQESSSDYSKYAGCDNFRLYRIGDAEEDGPAFDLYDLKANAGDYVAVSMPYPVKSEYFGQVYKIAEIQNGKAVLVAVDEVATGEPCVIKATGENNIKEGDVKLTYTTPKATVSMWDNTMMQGDLNKLTWTATAVDGSEINMAELTYTEADLANMDFTCTIENNAAARFWAQNQDYMAETPTIISKYLSLPAYNRTDQPNPVSIPVVVSATEQALSYSLSEDMMAAEIVTVAAGKSVAEIYNLLPGLTYYYKTADGKSAGKFTVGGTLRMIMIGKNVVNMRDLGGKKTSDGRYVKYGKLFRNAEFKGNTFNITDEEKQMLLDLNIGAELDLRNEDGNKPWLPNAVRGENFYWAEGKNYIANGPGKMYDAVAIPHLKGEFELIVNNLKKGVAVDFHCRIGADRTGFLAFLLEGLLGVSETDILLDYETTSFSEAGLRTKADGDGDADASSYEKVIPAEFRSKIPEGGTLRDVFEAYFINTLGVDKALIDEYRDIMLGDSPLPNTDDVQIEQCVELLQTEIANAALYVIGDDFGQYTTTDQTVVDDYMKTVDATSKYLESEGITLAAIKAQVTTLASAYEAMLPAISLNMPKAGDQFYLISKNYNMYIAPRAKTNWTVQGKVADKCIYSYDGQNITSNYTNLTFAVDEKNGVASQVATASAEATTIVPSQVGTIGCYNIKIGDYTVVTTATSGDKLTIVNNPDTDADIVIVRYIPEVPDAIMSIESGNAANTYNTIGQKVGAGYKGIIIRNGKKMVVK